MVIRFVFSGIVLLCSCSLYSQAITSEECFAVTHFDENYIIRLDGIDYNDNDKAFICEDNLPLNIEVRYKTSGDTVHDSTDVIIAKSHKKFLDNTELTVTQSVVLDIEGVDQKIDISRIHVKPINLAFIYICSN